MSKFTLTRGIVTYPGDEGIAMERATRVETMTPGDPVIAFAAATCTTMPAVAPPPACDSGKYSWVIEYKPGPHDVSFSGTRKATAYTVVLLAVRTLKLPVPDKMGASAADVPSKREGPRGEAL